MSIILKWPCKRCGCELSEKDYSIIRKFCPKCKEDIKKEKYQASNRDRTLTREYGRIKVNIFKNWVMWGERK